MQHTVWFVNLQDTTGEAAEDWTQVVGQCFEDQCYEVQGCSDQGCEEAVDERLQEDRMIRSEQDRLFEETLSIDVAKVWTYRVSWCDSMKSSKCFVCLCRLKKPERQRGGKK